ncbi:hypothetical protein J5N97_014869 [Dioscorea zingiberensis]|uniref:Uncharacterized protein n=1 Tax=Dioscorea zingiberensis TaxID=325984 RepID=A0A9D5HJX4_9LILI|nr:hypothetical protein J5N97_014869 [Dioscorea zingiberensis]
MLNRIVLLGNSFEAYAHHLSWVGEHYGSKKPRVVARYAMAVRRYVREVAMERQEDGKTRPNGSRKKDEESVLENAFWDTSGHFFELEDGANMDILQKEYEHGEEDVDASPVVRKGGYPIGKSVYDHKKANMLGKKNKIHSSFVDGRGGVHSLDVRPHTMKEKPKGKTNKLKYLHEFDSDKKGMGLMPYEKIQPAPLSKSYSAEKKRKGMVDPDHALMQSNYMHSYGSGMKHDEDFDGHIEGNTSGNRRQFADPHISEADHHEKMNMPLSACVSMANKWRGNQMV